MKKPEPSLEEFREAFKKFQEKHRTKETIEMERIMDEKRNKLFETIAMDASEYYILQDLAEFLKARQAYNEFFDV